MNNTDQENNFNPQSKAIQIEHILYQHGLTTTHSADAIRKNPMEVLDSALKIYEKRSEDHDKKAADFWDKYEKFIDKTLDQFGSETVDKFINDIKNLFK